MSAEPKQRRRPFYLPNAGVVISELARKYPATFVGNRRKVHRPLMIGIGMALINAGALAEENVNAVLRTYTARLSYQRALALGGPRYDLGGNPFGAVTEQQRKFAQAKVETKLKLVAARLAQRSNGHAPPKDPNATTLVPVPEPEPAPVVSPAPKAKLSLGDLRRLGAERRQREMETA
jgi:sRNA-binding protein